MSGGIMVNTPKIRLTSFLARGTWHDSGWRKAYQQNIWKTMIQLLSLKRLKLILKKVKIFQMKEIT
jgi:hypothetical protein